MSEARIVPQIPTPAGNSGTNSGQFRPGNVYRFQRNDSRINRAGAPKRLPISERLIEMLERRLPSGPEGAQIRKMFHLHKNACWADAIVASMVRQALKDVAVAGEIADRTEGKPQQRIELATPQNIHISVTYVDERLPD